MEHITSFRDNKIGGLKGKISMKVYIDITGEEGSTLRAYSQIYKCFNMYVGKMTNNLEKIGHPLDHRLPATTELINMEVW